MALPLISVVADFTAGPPAAPGLSAVSLNGAAPAVQTVLRGIRTQRGRQYELNKCEAGTLSLDVVDGSEWLNPANSSSPWNSGSNTLLPYRCVQAGMWWNAATKNTAGNLMNSANVPPGSTSFDPSFETSKAWVGYLNTSPTFALSTAQHFDGAQSLAITYNTSTDSAAWGLWTVPGQTYTLSMYVYVPASHTVTATFMNFPNAIGTTIATATSSTTGAWQRLTMTGVPSGPVCALQLTCTSAYPATVYLDAVQLELGPTANAFTTTGPVWFPLYTGYVERYPQRWDNAGFRGLKPLECVDALSPLSRAVISQSYAQTISADSPTVYIPYNDDAAPQAVQLPKGGQPYLGYTQLGSNSGAVNFGGDTFPDGSKAVTVVQQNTSPVTVNDTTQLTYIGTRQGSFSLNPQSFTFEIWAKVTSGTPNFGCAAMQKGESTIGEVSPQFWIGFQNSGSISGGQATVYYKDPNGNLVMNNTFGSANITTFPDGVWRYWTIRCLGSNQFVFARDLTSATVHTYAVSPSTAVRIDNFFVDASTLNGDPITDITVANLAVYPTALTTTQLTAHYQRGIGYLGELPGNRAARLLNQYWSSNIITDPGTVALSADFYYDPPVSAGQASQAVSVLRALEDIADTENGLVWVDAQGRVRFDARDTRYQASPTSAFTFGEAAGELPYLEVEYDYDPTYVYSDAQLTCDGTGNTLTSVNTASRTAYGQRILSKTMYAQNDWDVQQAANFYTGRYAKPAGAPGSGTGPRISRITLDPASNPTLVYPALALDIGDRITVKRRTSAAVTVSGDYYVEQITHQIAADASTWTVDYQLSPVFVPTVGVLGDSTYGVLGTTTTCVY